MGMIKIMDNINNRQKTYTPEQWVEDFIYNNLPEVFTVLALSDDFDDCLKLEFLEYDDDIYYSYDLPFVPAKKCVYYNHMIKPFDSLMNQQVVMDDITALLQHYKRLYNLFQENR